MASKFYMLACFDCGEFAKGKFSDVIEQSESHMCSIKSVEQKKDALLKLRASVDEEIARLKAMIQGKNICNKEIYNC